MNTQIIGRISEIQKNTFIIRYEGQEMPGKLKGSYTANPDAEWPVVGDYVDFTPNPMGESMINGIIPRTSVLKRPDQSGHAMGFVKTMCTQAMVANFDYVFIVTSLNGDYSYNRIARYVGHTLESGAVPVVVLTKSDVCTNPGRIISEVEELSDRIRVHAISALYGIGLDELEEYLQPGKTIVLLGSSGAGKSTLVNAIAGEDIMKTSEIRESDSKGRHTTTHRQMVVLKNGVTVIDTPGMREIGMMDVENGVDDTFSDIVELQSRCRFSDCRHDSEPGCAIKAALRDGTLSLERYELYCSLQRENGNNSSLKKMIAKTKKNLGKTIY